ncbi:uncharacterized protein LOC129793112 [Lutzomyia longipalpis]|uniref:uncharacterized protein LOC129793112 n=1 Tax=Lutzomyia longipalpis TaxID=7200 RepID=UPI00248434AE|nr:uncharacterized protein LOC129793112 [Lutzomyia longipalpis]
MAPSPKRTPGCRPGPLPDAASRSSATVPAPDERRSLPIDSRDGAPQEPTPDGGPLSKCFSPLKPPSLTGEEHFSGCSIDCSGLALPPGVTCTPEVSALFRFEVTNIIDSEAPAVPLRDCAKEGRPGVRLQQAMASSRNSRARKSVPRPRSSETSPLNLSFSTFNALQRLSSLSSLLKAAPSVMSSSLKPEAADTFRSDP